MSKKSEEFIDKYVVGKDDWLLKHKEVIAKLLDEYETEQLTIPVVVGQSEQLKAFVEWWHGLSQEELVWYEGRYVEVFLSL
jgi:hypothetical protein